MAFNTIDPNLQKSEISPAQMAALIRNVGYDGPLNNVANSLTDNQKTKLRVMTDALQSMKAGKAPMRLASGGYIFSPDELGDPQVKNRMKDNPEFSEFAIIRCNKGLLNLKIKCNNNQLEVICMVV